MKKVYQSNRKAVAVKDVVSTLEAYENEVREYKILTSNQVEDSIMLLNLKKMVPDIVRERLEHTRRSNVRRGQGICLEAGQEPQA